MKDADNLTNSNKILKTEEMSSTLLSYSKEEISEPKEERMI